jgi:hypothetical protein
VMAAAGAAAIDPASRNGPTRWSSVPRTSSEWETCAGAALHPLRRGCHGANFLASLDPAVAGLVEAEKQVGRQVVYVEGMAQPG